ncbi:MAG: PA14 domain-containing protein, partial [Acidobacteriota bacterium]|nr:PA14 domain-containing protein [Acidobacteriota bacterium]
TADLSAVTNNFTLAFWVNPRSPHQVDAQTTSGTGGGAGQRYAVWPKHGGDWGAGHAGAGVSVGTNGVSVYEHAGGYLPAPLVYQGTLSGWTHVAVIYENRQPRLYLNGKLVKTGVTSPKSFVHAQTSNLGGAVYGYFDGAMDDVRVYDRVLSATEVASLTSTLSAHWQFDEGSGASAADSTGNGNMGTISGAAWSVGKFGPGALSFDGVDDRVSVASTAGLSDVTNNFTLAFWVNPQSTHQIDSQTTAGAGGVSGQRYVFYPKHGDGWGAGHAGAGVSVGTNGVSVYEHAASYMPSPLVYQGTLSGWTHVVVVYENRRPSLYVNGALVKTGLTSPKSFVHAQTHDLGGYTGGYFDGLMDDVRVYDRVLSATEITSLTYTPSAHWEFDEGAGTSASDSTGSGNAGTISGPAWASGKVGPGALSFDGVDDHVSVTNTPSLSAVTNNFTLAFWVNPHSVHQFDPQATTGVGGLSGQRYVVYPKHGGDWGAGHAGAGVSVGTNGVSVYELAASYMPATLVYQGAISGWTHVAVVYENRQPRLYLNGNLVKAGLVSPQSFIHAQTSNLGGASGGYFDGLTDDVRVYDRILPDAEIVSLTSLARVNVALSANGGAAAASSTFDAARSAPTAINGDRRGRHWGAGPATTGGGWTDATPNVFPDWLEVTFASAETIGEIDVYTVQDAYQTPEEPTAEMTNTLYGLTAFEVQYWTGSAWAAVPGGVVAGNNKVWRRFTFAPVTTRKIRVVVTDTPDAYSRVVEVEAWRAAAPQPALGTGLTGYYFDNPDLTNHKLTRTDASVNFSWDLAAPAPSVGAEEFSVRWTGVVVPRHSETYTFYTTTDDGARLWVDGRLVIDKWQDQGTTEWSGQAALVAGREYDIRMEFYERWHGAIAKLSWSSPSQPKEVIPQGRLYPCWKTAEQFTRDFHLGALGRQPTAAELQEWQARLGAAPDFASLEGEARALGAEVFDSAEYAGRNRTDREFVYDLYWSYLQRGPDQAGWDSRTSQVATAGRAGVREALAGEDEFAEKLRRLCGVSASDPSAGNWGYNFSAARAAPVNRTGNTDPYSRNFSWSLPLVSLPGRAGLDLGLSLSYNSLVWTKDGSGIAFDADRGFPSPGFRLGFPAVQPRFYNPHIQQDGQPARYSYLLITPSGGRVELRQVGASNVYESADSSYLQLTDQGGSLALLSADGTRLSFSPLDGEYKCVEVKDRNGNYITVSYASDGQVSTVVDTLGRTVTFNYDANRNLVSISQPWRRADGTGSDPHLYATFGYKTLTLQPAFSNLSVVGAAPGATIPVVERVGLDDGSHYKFEYTAWGQVWRITHYAADSAAAGVPNDAHPLSVVEYNVPGWRGTAAPAQADCPRFTERRDWAENWNGDEGDRVVADAEQAVTSYSPWAAGLASCQVTLPDRTTVVKETYGAGWREGLTTQSEVFALASPGAALPATPKKKTVTTWEQDDAALAYAANPRVAETNVYDDAGNRRRMRVEYLTAAESPFRLPKKTYEYQANATTVWRRSEIKYRADSVAAGGAYTSLRVIGLVSERLLYGLDPYMGAEKLLSKVTYAYDEGGAYLVSPVNTAGTAVNPVRHDPAYGTAFVQGRGLVTGVRRWDAEFPTDQTKSVESEAGYNTAGAVVFTTDPSGHKVTVDYADRFSDGVVRSTFAYPTAAADPDQSALAAPKRALTTYDFDRGLVTKTRDLKDSERAFAYDAANRLKEAATLTNGAKTHFEYPASMAYVHTYSKVDADKPEGHAWQILDGAGRVIGASSDHPGSVGGYRGQETFYDVRGRAFKQSNPTEVDGAWAPQGDDAAGWRYTSLSFDWQGRPLRLTNADGTSRDFLYAGCGCAGGEVVVARDEVGRRRKTVSDILGRVTKVQDLTAQATTAALSHAADGSDVYRTATTIYNMRDQAVETQAHAGAAQADATKIQKTLHTYDGHGRLKSSKAPIQTRATAYQYNADDTLWKVLTPREAAGDAAQDVTTTFTRNARHLVRRVEHAVPAGLSNPAAPDYVAPAPAVEFDYDAAGNRLWMTDGLGRVDYTFDALSRLRSEARTFNDPENPAVAGVAKSLSYDYNLAGGLKYIVDPAGVRIDYSYDAVGRLTGAVGAGTLYGGVNNYAAGVRYRAWGALKELTYGNGRTLALQYNERLQVSHYEVPGVAAMEFQYRTPNGTANDNDGRAKFMRDLMATGSRFDRAYTYDAVGRLTKAVTGPEARGGADTGERPFRQTYAYDVWDNLIERVGRHWSQGAGSLLATLTPATGRNINWTYDASGRPTHQESLRTTYDAAGLVSRTQDTEPRAGFAAGLTIRASYGGDGLRVKHVENATAKYYVRSSVLGGQVVTELDGSGQFVRGYVYLGGSVLAKQEAGAVTWLHRNPVTGSETRTGAGGAGAGRRTELDPLGVDQGSFDWYLLNTRPERDSEQMGNRYSEPSSLDFGCEIDGLPGSCDLAGRMLRSGAGVVCPPGGCGPRSFTDPHTGRRVLRPLTTNRDTGELGYNVPVFGSVDRRVIGADDPTSNSGLVRVIGHRWVGAGGDSSFPEIASLMWLPGPQNLTPPDFVRDFYKYYQKRLARCIWRIFSKNALGDPSNVPSLLERQTIRNAPAVDMSKTFSQLGGAWGSVGNDDLSRGRYGTVNIASNINERNVGDFGVVLTRHQMQIVTYGHELGNVLIGRILGDVISATREYGSPTGGVNPTPANPHNDADQDPGARLEHCLFWEDGAPNVTKIR